MIARYSRPEMRSLWDDAAVYASWLEVELAAAEAMATRGTVPADAMEQLRAAQPPDAERVLEIERRTHHDVIAFLEAIEEQAATRLSHVVDRDAVDWSHVIRVLCVLLGLVVVYGALFGIGDVVLGRPITGMAWLSLVGVLLAWIIRSGRSKPAERSES